MTTSVKRHLFLQRSFHPAKLVNYTLKSMNIQQVCHTRLTFLSFLFLPYTVAQGRVRGCIIKKGFSLFIVVISCRTNSLHLAAACCCRCLDLSLPFLVGRLVVDDSVPPSPLLPLDEVVVFVVVDAVDDSGVVPELEEAAAFEEELRSSTVWFPPLTFSF